MNIKVIKTPEDHQKALGRIEELWDAQPDTPEGDEFEVLVTLVEHFEEKNYPIEAPDPVEAIKFRMEQQGLLAKDLTPFMGTAGRVSEVLHRKRRLTLNMIRNLHSGLNIPLNALIKDYQVVAE